MRLGLFDGEIAVGVEIAGQQRLVGAAVVGAGAAAGSVEAGAAAQVAAGAVVRAVAVEFDADRGVRGAPLLPFAVPPAQAHRQQAQAEQ